MCFKVCISVCFWALVNNTSNPHNGKISSFTTIPKKRAGIKSSFLKITTSQKLIQLILKWPIHFSTQLIVTQAKIWFVLEALWKLYTKAKRTKVQTLSYFLDVLCFAFSWRFVESNFFVCRYFFHSSWCLIFAQRVLKFYTKAKHTKVPKLSYSLHVSCFARSRKLLESKFGSSPFFCNQAEIWCLLKVLKTQYKNKQQKSANVVLFAGCFMFREQLKACWIEI